MGTQTPALFRLIAILSLASAASSTAYGESCAIRPHPLLATSAPEVEYAARALKPGHRFSLNGTEWELVRDSVPDATGVQTFAVTYPRQIASRDAPQFRDYFLSVEVRNTNDGDCNDVVFSESNPVHRLPLRESTRSFIRPRAGRLIDDAEHLESTRELVTRMRVRHHGQELLISTGFSTLRRLNLSGCITNSEDSLGIVEDQPGHFEVTCFPVDTESDHLIVINWNIDYGWPHDSASLIDDLIDYVYVEPIDLGVR